MTHCHQLLTAFLSHSTDISSQSHQTAKHPYPSSVALLPNCAVRAPSEPWFDLYLSSSVCVQSSGWPSHASLPCRLAMWFTTASVNCLRVSVCLITHEQSGHAHVVIPLLCGLARVTVALSSSSSWMLLSAAGLRLTVVLLSLRCWAHSSSSCQVLCSVVLVSTPVIRTATRGFHFCCHRFAPAPHRCRARHPAYGFQSKQA